MLYEVIFETAADDHQSRQLVRLLEALPLSVTHCKDLIDGAVLRSPSTPLVTFGCDPSSFRSLRKLGPRGWIAILPPEGGSVASFVSAGAFRVMRLPVERSALLSVIPRCLSAAGSPVVHIRPTPRA